MIKDNIQRVNTTRLINSSNGIICKDGSKGKFTKTYDKTVHIKLKIILKYLIDNIGNWN